jgi:hypothetical protein
LSTLILCGTCIKRCESVEGIDGLCIGTEFLLHSGTMFDALIMVVCR